MLPQFNQFQPRWQPELFREEKVDRKREGACSHSGNRLGRLSLHGRGLQAGLREKERGALPSCYY